MKRIVTMIMCAAVLLLSGEASAQGSGRKKKAETKKEAAQASKTKKSPYEELFKDKSKVESAKSDFISVHKIKGKLYFEIPLKYFEREMLLASTMSEASSPSHGDIGFKVNDPLHVKFTRADSTVFLCGINTAMNTYELQKAVRTVHQDPIMYAYSIKAWTPDSTAVLVDMTDLFITDVKQLRPIKEGMPSLIKTSATLKKEKTFLDDIKSFSDNLSVKSIMSYGISVSLLGIKVVDDDPYTAKMTRSLLLLPEDKMQPRVSDSRVGIFNSNKSLLSTKRDNMLKYSVAHRWRVEPADVEAYKRGELTDPVKPIVFYVDDAMPELWKQPIKNAVLRWNKAFEAIGFKNVMQARDFPTKEEDPEFDPDNLKYSCIRYLPSSTANAMGPSWVDPTTGEIINASVLVYSNITDMINRWRFVQTSQLDPRVRTKKMPDDIIKETMEYVVAHEVGHCLGFMHNMSASAAFPVDSLRSPSFTQKYGTTPCIMDYARFNYIAQPTDKGVYMTPPDLGVYDYFLIKWNYQYLPGYASEWEEKPVVEKWVDEKAGDPIYRYGRQQISSRYDPSAIEEDLGDDPVKAGKYGVSNLKYILSHLNEWITDDPDCLHRQSLYGEILNQYYRYLKNASYNIGGIYLTEVKEGTPGKRIASVAKQKQRESLQWILSEYRTMDWLDDPKLKEINKIGINGSYLVRDKIAKDLRTLLHNVILSAHYSDSPYSVQDFMNDLYDGTWNNITSGRALTTGDKTLQRIMVDVFCEPFAEKKASTTGLVGFAPSVDEIIAYGLDESGAVERYEDIFRRYEEENGHGSVTELLSLDSFGSPGMGFLRKVVVSSIDDSAVYLQSLAIRSQRLLRSQVANSSGDARAHYQSLLIKLNKALKDVQ